jgi:hypothetical protein
MIIFFESGQVGNQLFQYVALRGFDKKGPLFLIGMQSLKSMFDGVEVAGGKRLEQIFEIIIQLLGSRWLGALAKKIRLIGLIKELTAPTGSKFEVKNGLFKKLHYCYASFFQYENLAAESVKEKLQLKQELLKKASNLLTRLPYDRTETFFVHIRRGDYVHWPSRATPAVLPLKWYLEQMDLVRSNYVKPLFVVVSDDGPYADEMLAGYPDVFVSHEDEEVDFALMSLCGGGGILSASSFAWWAAYFARRDSGAAFFIAPLYWAGHRKGDWFPEGIKTSWIKYAAVN